MQKQEFHTQPLVKNLSSLIFASRWLQAPLYIGLIAVLGVYIYEFAVNLIDLIIHVNRLGETGIMLQALDLIDVVMIANLLIMVIIGGYETFVTHLNLQGHPDQPEWLDELNAGTMKFKFALALVTISSIHLLRTFIGLSPQHIDHVVMWQVIIHVTLVLSALAIAFGNRLISSEHGS